jgi:hypothetical protein
MTISAPFYDLSRLTALYTAGFHDTFLDTALHKIVDRQTARDEADLAKVNSVLLEFERQYGEASDHFARRFMAGEAADTADFMEWNAFYKMRQRILARLNILRDNGDYERSGHLLERA